MNDINEARLPRNNTGLPDGLPLFEWAQYCPPEHFQTQPLPLPVRHISRRYRLAPHVARVIAERAGFKMTESKHD